MKPTDTPKTNAASFHRDNGMHRDHPLVVTDEFAREMERELDAAHWLIRQIYNDLPTNRDWLNPEYEEAMKILSENAERIHGGAGQPKQPETSTPLDGASC